MTNIKAWCEGSIPNIVAMCDWYVQRESDGGVLAFKAAKEGVSKILVVAHLDFRASGKVHDCSPYHIVSSALDDRLGACLAFNLDVYTGIHADLVFCDKEESGSSTLPMLGTKMLDKYNWIVEFDRRLDDAVYYDYDCMKPYLEKHFTVGRGSMSDISKICKTSPIGAFNMGVGYNREHTETCYATSKMITDQLERFVAFYEEFADTRIPHTPPVFKDYNTYRGPINYHNPVNSNGYGGYIADDEDEAAWEMERQWRSDNHGKVYHITPKVIALPGVELPELPLDADTDLTDEDMEDYTALGYQYDKKTGNFYKQDGML